MKIRINSLVLFIVLFFSIYQDFPLVNVFGEIARSPIIFCLPILLYYIVRSSKIGTTTNIKYFFYYLVYLLIISIIFIPIVYFQNGSAIVLNENIVVKTVKMLVYPVSGFIFYLFVYNFLKKNTGRLNNLFTSVFWLQIIIAIYLFFEIYFSKTATVFMPFLHSTAEKYWRVRLFTVEESWVGNILSFFVFIPVFLVNYLDYKKSVKYKVYILSGFIFFYYTFVSESKGYLLLVIVSMLPMVLKFLYNEKKYWRIFVGLVPVFLVVLILMLFNLKGIVEQQLNSSITFGTRFTSYLSSLNVFITHPFGVGYSGFIYYFPQSISEVIGSGLVSNMNLHEIKGYLTTTQALSTKTEVFDGLMVGGLGFVLFFYHFFIKRFIALSKYQNKSLLFLKIPLVFSFLAGFIYITFHIKFEVWFLMALIDVIQQRLENERL